MVWEIIAVEGEVDLLYCPQGIFLNGDQSFRGE